MRSTIFGLFSLFALALARPTQTVFDDEALSTTNGDDWSHVDSTGIHVLIDVVEDYDFESKPADAGALSFKDIDTELRVLSNRGYEVERIAGKISLFNYHDRIVQLSTLASTFGKYINASAARIEGSKEIKDSAQVSVLSHLFMEIAQTAGGIGGELSGKVGYLKFEGAPAKDLAYSLEAYKNSIKTLGKALAPTISKETGHIVNAYKFIRDGWAPITSSLKGE